MKGVVEQNGKTFNFHPTPEEVAAELAAEKDDERVRTEAAEKDLAQKEKTEREERDARVTQDQIRVQNVLEDDKEAVLALSQPLRKYLMSNVVPCKFKPLFKFSESSYLVLFYVKFFFQLSLVVFKS